MLFNLEKLFVKREDFGWSPGPGRGKATFGVGQNFFEMSGRPHRKNIHFHSRLAVLKRFLCSLRPVGEFAALPDRHETKPKFISNRRPKKKAACIDADDLINL